MGVNTKIKIVKKEELKSSIIRFTCLAPEIAEKVLPGQFLEIQVTGTYEPFLRRPISIYDADKAAKNVTFIIQVKGRGTELLAQMKEGEMLDVVGPLGGNHFAVKDCKNVAIIGGGIGIFPLYNLAKECTVKTNVYLGFRSQDFVILEDEFKNVSDTLTITTDDGTYGMKGYALDSLKADFDKLSIDGIFACGPLPMLQKVKEFAESKQVYCQLSLEQRMACGIGACMGCSVKLHTPSGAEAYARVCKDGPVFEASKVEI